MRKYRFILSLCGGFAGGFFTVEAENFETAYDKAMKMVEEKLTLAFPSLEIDFNVEEYFPNTFVSYSVKGNVMVCIEGKDKPITKIENEAIGSFFDDDFVDLRDFDINVIGKPSWNEKMEKYEVNIEISGDYYVYVYDNDKHNEDELKMIGENSISNANFGKLKNAKWELKNISC